MNKIRKNQIKKAKISLNFTILLMLISAFLLLSCSDSKESQLTQNKNIEKQSKVIEQQQNVTQKSTKSNDYKSENSKKTASKTDKTNTDEKYKKIEWVDLIPKDDLDALLNPPAYINNIPEGAVNDEINEDSFGGSDSRYQMALKSSQVKSEFNGQKIRIPGFIAPLEFGEDKVITTFFLVPFFGACLHLPPPPPNQTIYAEFEPGIKLDSLYAPFWIEGTIATKLFDNDVATAAYTIKVDAVSEYSE